MKSECLPFWYPKGTLAVVPYRVQLSEVHGQAQTYKVAWARSTIKRCSLNASSK